MVVAACLFCFFKQKGVLRIIYNIEYCKVFVHHVRCYYGPLYFRVHSDWCWVYQDVAILYQVLQIFVTWSLGFSDIYTSLASASALSIVRLAIVTFEPSFASWKAIARAAPPAARSSNFFSCYFNSALVRRHFCPDTICVISHHSILKINSVHEAPICFAISVGFTRLRAFSFRGIVRLARQIQAHGRHEGLFPGFQVWPWKHGIRNPSPGFWNGTALCITGERLVDTGSPSTPNNSCILIIGDG